jgi:hypothetical protein
MQANEILEVFVHLITSSSAVVSDRCRMVRYVPKLMISKPYMRTESSQVNVYA